MSGDKRPTNLAALSDEDLLDTLTRAQEQRQRAWWRALIANGHHPENKGTRFVAFASPSTDPHVQDLDRLTEWVWLIQTEIERRRKQYFEDYFE